MWMLNSISERLDRDLVPKVDDQRKQIDQLWRKEDATAQWQAFIAERMNEIKAELKEMRASRVAAGNGQQARRSGLADLDWKMIVGAAAALGIAISELLKLVK